MSIPARNIAHVKLRLAAMSPRNRHSWVPYPVRSAASVVLVAAVMAGVLVGAPQPTASAAVSDGSDWGSRGPIASDSEVIVRWDNAGNSADNTVARADATPLPHTDGKTYADIDDSITSIYEERYGAGSADGLEVTVSPTRNLVSQAVQVSFSGLDNLGQNQTGSLQIFQCWGARGTDGGPNTAANAPDAETCQVGAFSATTRKLDLDPLVVGGDWDRNPRPTQPAPFAAVDGGDFRSEYGVPEYANPYFSATTTNELAGVVPDAGGTGTRTFDMQTGSEASGLGCGLREGTPSVSACWLVIVPLPNAPADPIVSQLGALSPSVWGQRMQVKLEFSAIAGSCPGGQARALTGGSELTTVAMASWIPGVCNSRKVAVGYSTLGDEQARTQLGGGAQNMVFTTRPSTELGARHAPVAISAVVIGYTIDEYDASNAGAQIRDLKLTPRLVAKLLTQSYFGSVDPFIANEVGTDAPWVNDQPATLKSDPEFQRLNPQVDLAGANALDSSVVMVESLRSDAADAVWRWLTGDRQASAFLNGCPDDDGAVVNPIYSTRTYVGCEKDAAVLDDIAQDTIDGTVVPDGFVSEPMQYPSDAAAYPLPGWYQREAKVENGLSLNALTLGDLHPRQDTMASTGRNAFRALVPHNTDWCQTISDPSCIPEPGRWKSPSIPQLTGNRTAMAITDAATAARYQLPTFDLCDSQGENCVGANTQSLTRAAAEFTPSEVAGVALPSPQPNYEGGAYPLALPVYAAVQTQGMLQADAAAIADTLDYIATAGQVPGFGVGALPPGYAPLSADRSAQTAAVVADLRAIVDPPATSSAPPAVAAAPRVLPPTRVVPPAAPAEPQLEVETVAQVGTTPPTEVGFPQLGLFIGLAAAVLTGLWSPVIGRRRRVIR